MEKIFLKLLFTITLTLILFSSSVYSTDITSGLVAYYPFNGNMNDASGNGNPAINHGAVTKYGIDVAYDFYADEKDYASVANSSLQTPSNITLSLWIYPYSTSDTISDGGIIGKYDEYGKYSYALWYSRGKIYFEIGDNDIFETKVSTNIVNASNRWYHVTGTYDGSSVKLFIDGELKATASENRAIGVGASPLCIGTVRYDCVTASTYANETDSYFDGRIDEIKLFNRALNSTEVALLASPAATPRSIAEFEPMEGALVRYPLGLPIEIPKEIAKSAKLVTLVSNQTNEDAARQLYQNNGFNMGNVSFIQAPNNGMYTRDFGPWFIFDGEERAGIIDFDYNSYGEGEDLRPLDDFFNNRYGKINNIFVYNLGLDHVGGNYMTDGMGVAASVNWARTANSTVSETEFNQKMLNYLGINKYYLVDNVLSALPHIDTFAKFLAPDKIMIKQVPTSNSNYQKLENLATFFSNEISSFGTPYKVYRVYSPNGEPYTNALILNNKVLVPIKDGQTTANNNALNAYREAMPGYTVIGFGNYTWLETDSLHCRTKELADTQMLYINHIPLKNQNPNVDGFPIEAKVIPYSKTALKSGLPKIYWKLSTSTTWNTITMNSIGNGNYRASIPNQQAGKVIQYYIHAEDNSERSENKPYIGSLDPYSFTVTTSQPIECTEFFYSDWAPAICPTSGIQTRNITLQNPPGCSGGNHEELTRTCTYGQACTINNWTPNYGNCTPSNYFTKTWVKVGDCSGGVAQPATQQLSCNYALCSDYLGLRYTQNEIDTFKTQWGNGQITLNDFITKIRIRKHCSPS